MRALFQLDKIFDRGTAEIYCDEINVYYTALIELPDNARVLPGMGYKKHLGMMRGASVDVESDGCDSDVVRNPQRPKLPKRRKRTKPKAFFMLLVWSWSCL